jgi:2-iminobutanoate/2-iminopropanoate deaminase
MKKIQVIGSPTPVGHYSQAIWHPTNVSGLLFTSGILPIKVKTSEKLPIESSIEEQFLVVLENLRQILLAADLDKKNVLKTTVFISDGENWGIVNQMYADFFGDHRPARSIIPVKELHFGYKIELEAIAG